MQLFMACATISCFDSIVYDVYMYVLLAAQRKHKQYVVKLTTAYLESVV